MGSIEEKFIYIQPSSAVFNARMKNPSHLCTSIKSMNPKPVRGIQTLFDKNPYIICHGNPNGLLMTVQRIDNTIVYLNCRMQVIPKSFNTTIDEEIKRFSSLLPDNTGLDGKVTTSNEGLSKYIIIDIITQRNITLDDRMNTLRCMYNTYIEKFNEPKFFSIIEYAAITNIEDLTSYMTKNNYKFLTLGKPNLSYRSGNNRNTLKMKNENYRDEILLPQPQSLNMKLRDINDRLDQLLSKIRSN